MQLKPWAILFLAFVVVSGGCASPQSSRSEPAPSVSSTAGSKRITAAMMSDPPTISTDVVGAGGGTIQGGDALEDLVNAGFTTVDNTGGLRAQLAEVVPTVDNGLWIMFPDGRMQTTWRLRPGILWHDGTPFTIDDLLFSARVARDRELPFLQSRALDWVERIEQPDAQTVTVQWNRPYIQADRLFSRRLVAPRPAHVLAATYDQNKQAMVQVPYWNEAYVGTGPFRVKQWVPGSHLLLTANDRYVLGKPRIEEIEVRFIPDSGTLAANLLAGEVMLTLGRNLSLQQATQLGEQWKAGRVQIGIKNWFAVWPQLLNPDPQVVLDVRFRRALMYALDRQQLVETLQQGLVPVADSFISPKEAAYPAVESQIVKYGYDPNRSSQLLEVLGYARSRDGLWTDASGQALRFEVRSDGGGGDDAQETTALIVADQWKRAGLAAEPLIIAQLQRRDREYNSTFPAWRVWRQPNDLWTLDRYGSQDAPVPENHFDGGNRSRYMNPEFDALLGQYMATIREQPRLTVLGQIVHHMTDQMTVLGLYYNTEPLLASSRLLNVTGRDVGETTEAWNAHEWDLQ